MDTITYPLRLDKSLYLRVKGEAERRRKSLAEVFRDTITYGLPALPPLPETEGIVADTWDKLGPAPQIDYDKL